MADNEISKTNRLETKAMEEVCKAGREKLNEGQLLTLDAIFKAYAQMCKTLEQREKKDSKGRSRSLSPEEGEAGRGPAADWPKAFSYHHASRSAFTRTPQLPVRLWRVRL